MIPSFLLNAALRLAPSLPEPAIDSLARATARLEYAFSSKRRRAVESNLAWIAGSGRLPGAPPPLRRTVRAIFESYHRFLLEYLSQRALGAHALDTKFRFEGMELLYEALSLGRGAVVAAPHVGNWELAGIATARLGHRVHVVTGVQFHPAFTGAARALKDRERILVSTPEEGFRPLLRTLREGGIVVLLADGDVFVRSLETEFFGRRVALPAGPALLARRARSPLLFAHAERRPAVTAGAGNGAHRPLERHVVSFDGVELPDPALPLKEDLLRLTRRVAEYQERAIAANLTTWCIFRPLFPASDAA